MPPVADDVATATVERLEIRLLAIPLVEPFAAAHGTTAERLVTVVRVATAAGTGWGECAALSEPTYSPEHAAGAFDALARDLGPRLLGRRPAVPALSPAAGGVDGWLDQVLEPAGTQPMARAALEMALLDAGLRAAGWSLASWLAAGAATVPAGVAVGLGAPEAVADRVEALAAEGYRRVKLKICPGRDEAVVAAVRTRRADVEIQVDGNGSFGADHLDRLADLGGPGGPGVSAIEQPFAPGRPDLAAALVARLGTPPGARVVADEAATDQGRVLELHQAGALSAVSVKPSRLGGLVAARALHQACLDREVPLTPGGMVETGLGRHALAAVAALPGFTLTGDVSPARRWLVDDPWPDLTLTEGRIAVPTGPGVAPDPDPGVLERFTRARAELRPA